MQCHMHKGGEERVGKVEMILGYEPFVGNGQGKGKRIPGRYAASF